MYLITYAISTFLQNPNPQPPYQSLIGPIGNTKLKLEKLSEFEVGTFWVAPRDACRSLRSKHRGMQIRYITKGYVMQTRKQTHKTLHDQGIEAVPIGPIVFYSGFTREFLSGNTLSSDEMLAQVGR